MQCPNCQKVEKGQWLYANGSARSFPEFGMDDWNPDEDPYDLNYFEMVKSTNFSFSESEETVSCHQHRCKDN